MYSPQVLDHFQQPRNAGDLTNPDISVQRENPACGDVLNLTPIISEDRIAQIGFRAKGCVPAMACASLPTELANGKTTAAAGALSRAALVSPIGGLPDAP